MLLRPFKKHERRLLRAMVISDVRDVLVAFASILGWVFLPVWLFFAMVALIEVLPVWIWLGLPILFVWVLLGCAIFLHRLRLASFLLTPPPFYIPPNDAHIRMMRERLEQLDKELG